MPDDQCTHEHPVLGRCAMPAGHNSLTDVHVYSDDTNWPGRCTATFFGKVRCAASQDHDGAHRTDDILVW